MANKVKGNRKLARSAKHKEKYKRQRARTEARKLRINITEENVENGDPENPWGCPVSIACQTASS